MVEGPKRSEKPAASPHVGRILPRITALKPHDGDLRANPPHVGGAFQPTRLFGGVPAVQMYAAAKRFRPNDQTIRMDICFLSGGTTHDPIDYALVGDHGEAIRIESRQKGKLLNFAHLRVVPKEAAKERLFTCSTPVFFPDLPRPSDCPPLRECLKRVNIPDWQRKFGTSYKLRNTPDSRGIFEIRPVDPFQFGGLTHEQRPVAVWLRLREHLQEVRIEDKMTVPLLLSDYVVGLPSTNAFDIRRIRVKTMASMNHKVFFHTLDFDPKGFFLQIEEAECINGMSLTRGRIFTKDGRPVLSYVQQGYFQLDEAVISKI